MLLIETSPEKLKFKVIEGWEELNIHQYAEIARIIVKNSAFQDTEALKDPLNNAELLLSMRSITLLMSDLDAETFDKLHISNVETLASYFISFLTDVPDQEKTFNSFKFKGKKYDLPANDFQNMTFERYMDIKTLESEINGDNVIQWDRFAGVVACLVDRYEEENVKLFESLPMSTAWQLFFFIKKLTKNINQSFQDTGTVKVLEEGETR